MSKWLQHIVLDVESDGPCPGLYNMISFGLVSLADPTVGFLGEVAPILDHAGIPAAREVSGVSFQAQQAYREPGLVMAEARDWIARTTGGKRAIFWSDNPAFDWQFWNWYAHKFLGENPAGFSARRIGDLDAGRRGEPLNTAAWKKRRQTAHTHNPLDDARGNAEALRWVLGQMGENSHLRRLDRIPLYGINGHDPEFRGRRNRENLARPRKPEAAHGHSGGRLAQTSPAESGARAARFARAAWKSA